MIRLYIGGSSLPPRLGFGSVSNSSVSAAVTSQAVLSVQRKVQLENVNLHSDVHIANAKSQLWVNSIPEQR